MSEQSEPESERRDGHSRRSFLRTSGGIATGIAVTVLPTGVVALAAPGAADAKDASAVRVTPEGDVPHETVMAYVHDAKGGVVTVVSSSGERSYRDPALVRRLLDAAGSSTEETH